MLKMICAALAAALLLALPAAAAPIPYGMNLAPAVYGGAEFPFIDIYKLRAPGAQPDVANPFQVGIGPLNGRFTYDIITSGPVTRVGFAGGVVSANGQQAVAVTSGAAPVTTKLTLDHQGPTSFKLWATGPAKVAIVESSTRAAYDAGEVFRPAFVDSLRGFEVLRFMDWNATNGRFYDGTRALPTDPVWSPRVPVEVQAQLASKVGADMWLNLPAGIDGGGVADAVKAADANLAPGLRILLEYSNEIWNAGFKQTPWMNALATTTKMPPAQMYGLLSGSMAKAAAAVAGPARIRTMLCWQGSAMSGQADNIMKGWDMSGTPRSLIGGFCVATYPDLVAADAGKWTAWAEAGDIKSAVAYMLGREAVRAAYYPAIAAKAKAYGTTWSLYEYNSTGLQTSAPSPIAVADRPAVLSFNQAVAHSPEAAAILKANRAAFDAAGGLHYVLYNDVGAGSQYGQWGTLGASSLDLSFPAAPLVRAANDNAWQAMKPKTTAGYLSVTR